MGLSIWGRGRNHLIKGRVTGKHSAKKKGAARNISPNRRYGGGEERI